MAPFPLFKRYGAFDSSPYPMGGNVYEDNIQPNVTSNIPFDPSSGNEQDNSEEPEKNPQDTMASRLKMLYDANQSGPATKRFQAHLSNMPEFNPSKMQRLGAGLSGGAAGWNNPGAGSEVAQRALRTPFEMKQRDWATKGGALEKGAEIEDKGAKEKVALFRMAQADDKEAAKEKRQATLDTSTINLHNAQIANYESLAKARANEGWSFHQNNLTGELIGINPRTNETKNFGKVKLTPQEQQNLDVTKFGKEEGIRQKNRVDLFNTEQPAKEASSKRTHEANRSFDVSHPLPVRDPRNSYVSATQQTVAYKQAAKELNTENKGAYSDYINKDGSIKSPDELGGMFSSGDKEALAQFFELVKQRADVISSRTKGTESRATGKGRVIK